MIRIRAHLSAVLAAVATTLLVAGMALSPVTAQPLFPNPVYPVGLSPFDFAQADFDEDGLPDLMVANLTRDYYDFTVPGDLSFLRGRGDGTFDDEVRTPVSGNPVTLIADDFNLDGHADLVLLYWDAAVLLPGRGDASFGAEVPIEAAGTVTGLQRADIDSDSRPDLFVGGTIGGNHYLQALLNNGRGGFIAGPVLTPGLILSTTVADVNGDDRDDFLAVFDDFRYCDVPIPPVNQVNRIVVYLGQGDGSFVQSGGFNTGEWTSSIIPADLDADGRTDLVINGVRYEGCSGYSGRVIYYGNGDGSFTAAGPFEVVIPSSVILPVELNGDGIGDYIDSDGWTITVHLGLGDRTFTALPYFFAGVDMYAMRLGDYDQDGRTDLAALGTRSEAVFIFAGNGDGTFGPPRIPALEAAGLNTAATGDFDNNGAIDIVAADYATGEAVVLLGQGGGTFGAETRYAIGLGPYVLTTADLNGDGREDIVAGVDNWQYYPPELFPAGSLAILVGNGDGTFRPVVTYESGPNPIAIAVDDFNEDGAPDVVLANWGGGFYGEDGDLSLYLGHGDGTVAPQVRVPVGVRHDPFLDTTTPVSLAVGDFDVDGHRDLVVGMRGTWDSPQPGEVEILFGDGLANFSAPVPVVEVWSAESVAVGDLNRDGLDDIAVADPAAWVGYAPGGLYVLTGAGDGTFSGSGLLPAGVGPYQVQIDDFNVDGIPDLAATNNGGYLVLLPGNGDGTFGPRLNFGLFGVPLSVVKGDFDGDGRPDLMVISESGAFVYPNATGSRLAIEASLAFEKPLGRGAGTVTWTTNGESDLKGFNVVILDNKGRRQLNDVVIPCQECITGQGATYVFLLSKHRSGRDLYIEALHEGGRVEVFGPVRRE